VQRPRDSVRIRFSALSSRHASMYISNLIYSNLLSNVWSLDEGGTKSTRAKERGGVTRGERARLGLGTACVVLDRCAECGAVGSSAAAESPSTSYRTAKSFRSEEERSGALLQGAMRDNAREGKRRALAEALLGPQFAVPSQGRAGRDLHE